MSVLVDGIEVDYSGLPECARDILERYVEHGCYPGSGYAAILANDLKTIRSAILTASSVDALKVAWELTKGKKGKLGDLWEQLEAAKNSRKAELAVA